MLELGNDRHYPVSGWSPAHRLKANGVNSNLQLGVGYILCMQQPIRITR